MNGRKLSLNIYDDQWDVTRHAALVRQAVEQDKVFAFVANIGILTDHGAAPYLEEKKIPVIGGDHVDTRAWGVSPMYFPVTELEAEFGGRLLGRWAATQGCQRVGAQSASVDESRKWAASFRKGLEDSGFKKPFVYEGENSLAETDFSAYAVRIRAANVDCLTVGQYDTHMIRMRQALKQVNHQLKMFGPSSFYTPTITESGLFDGDFGLNPADIVESAATNPAIAELAANMTKYEPKLTGQVSNFAVAAWTSAKVAVEIIRRMGNDLTRQNLLATLHSTKNLDVGLVPPISYQPGPNKGQSCGYLIQVKDKKFQLVNPRMCM